MSSPLVSVIIPNYNHAPYLRARIDSVLAQDYPSFEVILLDDCSQDNSREIIDEYVSVDCCLDADDRRISQVVFNNQNSGSTFVQWERGLSLAKGKYIWIAESDDIAKPTFLSALVGELEKCPEATVAYSHSFLIDAEGQVLSEHNAQNPAPQGLVTVHRSAEFMKYLLAFNDIYNASMAVFRKDIVSAINRDYMKYRYCGDWHFWASVCSMGDVIEVHDMLNGFRQHTGKVTVHSTHDTVTRWTAECEVLLYVRSCCQLSPFQNRCFKGRVFKHMHAAKMPREDELRLRSQYAQICGGFIDVVCYEIGKNLFGFLRHRQKIGFLSSFALT